MMTTRVSAVKMSNRGYPYPVDLTAELRAILPRERVLTRPIDLVAYSCDASFYTLTPRAVVRPSTIAEVQDLLALSGRLGVSLTFRAAGTSLSGQAIGDGIVVDVSRHWRKLDLLDEGKRVRVGPGVIGGKVNAHLRHFGRKLGPDPASIDACMIGGIVSNNSSGMCCGIEHNAYRTVESVTLVLPSGLLIDTAEPGANEILLSREPAIAKGVLDLRDRIAGNPSLAERIRRKYRMKNTMGYSLNAFLDFTTPLEILAHLLIGAEGTLAFIAEVVFRTIPDHPEKSAGLLLFPDVHAASSSIAALRDSGAAALELMDRASLRSIEKAPGIPALVSSLSETGAAILVEYQTATAAELALREEAFARIAPSLPLLDEPTFTRDAARRAELWAARKGLMASVGAMRKQGTSLIFEDVTFPLEHLADGVSDLQALFVKHGYPEGIVFGHAKDGNIHFVLAQSFNDRPSIDQYERFTADLVEMVVGRYDGALKAEHGTGRNMAPFVETEWGADAYAIMKEVKALVDPDGLLNPGVILNPDPRVHLKSLKSLPQVEPEVDRCIECGFCESKCPSRDLTLTPRQRIVVRRAQKRLEAKMAPFAAVAALEADIPYDMIDTCAADGMCATACPVGIDTGTLVKRLRARSHRPAAKRIAAAAASHFRAVERIARFGLKVGHGLEALLGVRAVEGIARGARTILPAIPPWAHDLPPAASRALPATSREGAAAVYVPSCLSRVLGPEARGASLPQTLVTVAARAGAPVWIPPDVAGTCCGMLFSSKGCPEAHDLVLNRAVERFWEWSDRGRVPVVTDTSPCAWSLRSGRESLTEANQTRFDALTIQDGIELAHDVLLPRLAIHRRRRAVALHPVCSAVKLGIDGKLADLARACAEEAVVPLDAGCCGFAGDRGLSVPELTRVATRAEADEILLRELEGSYSSSRMCEIAMTRATGRSYRSFWHLLDEATSYR